MTVLMPAPPAPLVLPRIGVLLRHAAPRVFESMILPVLVFYVALVFTNTDVALAVAAAWVYGGVAWRLVKGGEAPGTLLLAAGTITVRVVLTVATGNPIVFFLQPCLGVFCVSMGFLLTAPLQRPLMRRVVSDLVPLPDQVMEHPRMRRFFVSQSVLWGCAQLLNGALSLWLLLSQTLETYLLVRTSAVAVLLGGAALVSVLSFRHCLRRLETRGTEIPERVTPEPVIPEQVTPDLRTPRS